MTTATVSDIQIEALVAWAKVSCRQFMRGIVPEKFWYQYEPTKLIENGKPTGNALKHSTTRIEGMIYYGAYEHACVISRGDDGVYTWRAYIDDPTEPDCVLFHTSDIIKESV